MHNRLLFATTLLCLLPSVTHAQIHARSNTGRARMELSLDHGFGFSTEGEYIEVGMDLRVYAPEGVGAILRTGVATQLMTIAYVADAGVAYRFDLFATDRVGLQIGLATGVSVGYGPFDRGEAPALGGFAMAHLDLRTRGMFFGIGVTTHALRVFGEEERNSFGDPRSTPVLSATPVLRIGGEWGL
ncbi:MAG: hypothetical protein AB8I08_15870 [Sandaracinaceae bacterium]